MLTAQNQSVVLHFGEMASHWGFSRSVGQVLALLVLHEQALHAEQIREALGISRGNVSMALRELQSWRLVKLHHQVGERREYFSVAGSIWELGKIVFEERRRREIDPTLNLLEQCLNHDSADDSPYAKEKLAEIHDLLSLLTQWSSSLNNLKPETLKSLMKLGSGISKVVELKEKVVGGNGSDTNLDKEQG